MLPRAEIYDFFFFEVREHFIKNMQNLNQALTNQQPEMIILSEVSQTEKDKYHMISLICGI